MKPLFDVIVVATMSAGKSTVINALIGKELLHSANEATTATITKIHDKDNLPFFSGRAFSYQNEILAEEHQINADILKKWNADPNIKTIDIVGDIQALQNSEAELVIYDTPGPNNSQDENHEKLTMEVINDGNYGLILYVLNATQIGVNDDLHLLESIHRSLEKDKSKEIIFLLNKADCLDKEKGELLSSVVERVEGYLSKVGFIKPIIIPTSANIALVANKLLNGEKLTRYQRMELKSEISNTSNKDALLYAKVSKEIKSEVLAQTREKHRKTRIKISDDLSVTIQFLKRLYIRSGFGIVNYILQNFLDKKTEDRRQKTEDRRQKTEDITKHWIPNNNQWNYFLQLEKTLYLNTMRKKQ